MKKLILLFVLLATALQPCFAGGNSSIVDLDQVISIKIENEKIVIVGSGMIRKRIMSDAEHGDATAFGQPAQMVHAKVKECTFEVIPYHLRSDVKGVPGVDPDNVTPKEKAQSMKWWSEMLASAREIKVGDAITIGYQREKMTITGLRVTHIVGSGFAKVRKPQ